MHFLGGAFCKNGGRSQKEGASNGINFPQIKKKKVMFVSSLVAMIEAIQVSATCVTNPGFVSGNE